MEQYTFDIFNPLETGDCCRNNTVMFSWSTNNYDHPYYHEAFASEYTCSMDGSVVT